MGGLNIRLVARPDSPPSAAEEDHAEPAAGRRRRPNARAQRTTGPSLAPIPRLENPFPPLELLTPEQVERIVLAAYRVLEEAGLEIRNEAAREIFRRHGAIVDEATQLVRIGRDIVEAQLAHAPSQFVLHSRNPQRHMHVGGNTVNFGPVSGAPNISDLERGRRYGDLEGFRNILHLTQALGILHWQGGIVVEPMDIPVPVRHLSIFQAHIE
ncbi:MAG: trimethylamine methyltransferase family protein, partial [Proteobacteria bacterium]|nr:trimethylamine methyltransferase family protein [Pseudomonadota bacterium]